MISRILMRQRKRIVMIYVSNSIWWDTTGIIKRSRHFTFFYYTKRFSRDFFFQLIFYTFYFRKELFSQNRKAKAKKKKVEQKNQFTVPRQAIAKAKLGIKINLSRQNERRKKEVKPNPRENTMVWGPAPTWWSCQLAFFPYFLFPCAFYPVFCLCKLLEMEFKKHVSRLRRTPTQWMLLHISLSPWKIIIVIS